MLWIIKVSLLLQQKLFNGKYQRKALIMKMNFKVHWNVYFMTPRPEHYELVNGIVSKLYMTGVLIEPKFAIILVKINGIHKFCITKEIIAKVTHLL